MDLSNYEIKIRENFQFFKIRDEYINYIKTYDKNVCDNYHEGRTYIGILFEINNLIYFAPLTSAGKEYLNLKKYKRIVYPINEGELGYIRLGNMIPVPKEELRLIIISEINEDAEYRTLLLNQYIALKKTEVKKKIILKARKLYDIRYNNTNHYLNDLICDFKLLEEKCVIWSADTTLVNG